MEAFSELSQLLGKLCINNPGSNEVPLLATKISVECSSEDIITVLNFRAIPCHKHFFIEMLCSYSSSFHVVVLQFATHWFNSRFYGSSNTCSYNALQLIWYSVIQSRMWTERADDLPKFSGLSTLTSGYSLCKNWLTCFKNEVSDISCFLMSIMYWAADQKFLSSNTLVTKTSSACELAGELRSTKLVSVSVRTCSVSLFSWTHVANNEWAPDLTIVTYFLNKIILHCLSLMY